ncbi:hypothetical protein FIBSPDRAFT_71113 [Athelia psychrophila]|uniref:Alcohol dehydrogenase-like C-terminal domain-containing protein n=1 Tax=Athelia psychrophila TaxID=1759441 RepID=A0A166TWZ0_9AGAM|nr:hypothetical protein FIBSPDRAFT_71113 [Fibularhizoctonia sp. CBS 109695]
MDDLHLAACPVGCTTAWRATMVNGRVSSGQTVLVTGAGGGVAIIAIQLLHGPGAGFATKMPTEPRSLRTSSRKTVLRKSMWSSTQLAVSS